MQDTNIFKNSGFVLTQYELLGQAMGQEGYDRDLESLSESFS